MMSSTDLPVATDLATEIAAIVGTTRVSWVADGSRRENDFGGFDWSLRNGMQLRLAHEDAESSSVEWLVFGKAPGRIHLGSCRVFGVTPDMAAAMADALVRGVRGA